MLQTQLELELEQGTQKDNCRDTVERGRSLKGEKHSQVVLTEEQAIEILRVYNLAARLMAGCISSQVRRTL